MRFLSLCGGDLKKWKLAFLVLAFYPGIPSLFYGDEKGIEGIKEFAYRSPMKWEERNETAAFVKEVMKIRKKYVKSGMKGRLYVPENQKNLLILERRVKNDVIEIQMNTGVDLCGMDLSGMDLSGMDLCGMEEKEESTALYGEGISEESIGASGFVIIYRKETSE